MQTTSHFSIHDRGPPITVTSVTGRVGSSSRACCSSVSRNVLPISSEGSLSAGPPIEPTPKFLGIGDRKSTRLNSSHANISYAVFCLKNKNAVSPPSFDPIASIFSLCACPHHPSIANLNPFFFASAHYLFRLSPSSTLLPALCCLFRS